ncbi:MAG: hypothetical protein PVG39_26210 [Desulfobacteraceae bacterium]|jgi:hypothetical protein
MTKVEVFSGICGFTTRIEVEEKEKYVAVCRIEGQCPNCSKVAAILAEDSINVMDELFRKGQSKVIEACQANLPHVSCPVPAGILKALEVGVGLALPADASIKFIETEKK